MALTVTQRPTSFQPAQSPVIFTVSESGAFVTASNFQYTADLYIYGPTLRNSGSASEYSLRKYPNQSKVGIFDFSKWLTSFAYTSSAVFSDSITVVTGNKYYYVDFGWQYESGSTYVTSSLTRVTASVLNNPLAVYGGYDIWNDSSINEFFYNTSSYTFATDMYTVTQSYLATDVQGSGCPKYNTRMDLASYPDTLITTASYTDGTQRTRSTPITPSGYTGSNAITQIVYDTAPSSSQFPFYVHTASLTGAPIETYNYKFLSGSTQVSPTFNFEIVCEQYYTPVRIGWLNRFNAFDFMNFYKRSDQTFSTEERLYQPELSEWNSSTFSKNNYQVRQQRYIVDANQTLIVNSDWLEEGYNNIIKQLLVSDRVNWLYDQTETVVFGGGDPFTGSYFAEQANSLPLTVKTSNVQFKTHTNNKLIQYTIEFYIGQPYKFII